MITTAPIKIGQTEMDPAFGIFLILFILGWFVCSFFAVRLVLKEKYYEKSISLPRLFLFSIFYTFSVFFYISIGLLFAGFVLKLPDIPVASRVWRAIPLVLFNLFFIYCALPYLGFRFIFGIPKNKFWSLWIYFFVYFFIGMNILTFVLLLILAFIFA